MSVGQVWASSKEYSCHRSTIVVDMLVQETDIVTQGA